MSDLTPETLGDAWDRGADFAVRHPGMSAEYIRAANPFRSSEFAHMREARDNARAEVERLTALIAEVRDAMEDESNLDGWVGNYVRTSTIRRILDGADS